MRYRVSRREWESRDNFDDQRTSHLAHLEKGRVEDLDMQKRVGNQVIFKNEGQEMRLQDAIVHYQLLGNADGAIS